ncbi:hypothetical protein PLICRDRAFT_172733 [Plicaturopsis crispa FD-325 SS-3]|nr:hypothetical protein PLICRDRAFT_172733 [Plicaturopsis crispa FD-325 SS-3]
MDYYDEYYGSGSYGYNGYDTRGSSNTGYAPVPSLHGYDYGDASFAPEFLQYATPEPYYVSGSHDNAYAHEDDHALENVYAHDNAYMYDDPDVYEPCARA